MPEFSELESTAAFWDWVSYIAIAVAFFAAVSEFITIWTSWIKPQWKSKIEKTSALLVLIGSAAGMIGTWQLSNINGRIIATLNKEAATAQLNAGKAMTAAADAQTRLAEARERTARVEAAAANAYKTAKEAEARALSFEAQIASANVRAKEAEARAAQAQVDLARFEAPRTLSREQQQRIAAKMKRFSGQKFAVYVTPVREATKLLDVVGQVLISSGWILVPSSQIILIGKAGIMLVNGVKIQVAPSRERDLGRASQALADALISEKIETKAEINPELEKTPDIINVIVGDKW